MLWKTKSGQYIEISKMETSHIANTLHVIAGKHETILFTNKAEQIGEMIDEFEKRTDISQRDFDRFSLAVQTLENERYMSQTYNIRINSPFILTQTQVKNKLGPGYKVLSVEAEKDLNNHLAITDVDSAVENIILVGYRALARAFHPDLGGDTETMVILNRAKKELSELLKDLKA